MVLQMRGTISASNPWDVMVDLFFYRDPEELEDKPDEPEAAAVPGAKPRGTTRLEVWRGAGCRRGAVG